MKTAKIRQLFLDFFKGKNHTEVSSSSLVPHDDPSLLFTNAGMVQFKDAFLGKQDLGYVRAVTTQKCVRAGGKHNDLENVGFTARHHTFFEMLGNFSFGDYFKKEAIEYGWEFVTKVLKIPKDKLWITIFEQDHEAEDIWLNHIGIDPEKFSRCGEKDNFWAMGDTGPCGPCTEIFYDHGESVEGGPPGSINEEGDRYVEIWNIVFMQYERDKNGKLTPIPKPSVDTGMGLERVAAVMQNVHSNYQIDLFKNIINAISKLLGVNFEADLKAVDKKSKVSAKSLNVIADHLRSCAFLVADGVLPSNDGRGYVLRRIMRRSIRHGKKLGAHKPFFHKLVDVLVDEMGDAFPELKEACDHIAKVFLQEELQFGKTLEQGLKIFDQSLEDLKDNIIPGELVFKLYDTYGFPLDLTQDIARERDYKVDIKGFEEEMIKQRERARTSSKFEHELNEKIICSTTTEFVGYETLSYKAKIVEMFLKADPVTDINEGENAIIVLDRTPFYAESGGQIGDRGEIKIDNNVFIVEDTIKNKNAFIHYGRVISGNFSVNDFVYANVDKKLRDNIIRNHSATHLLHAALRSVLGEHVVQKGSNVTSESLRFDFTHNAPLTEKEVQKVESIVNAKIRENSEILTEILPIKVAKEKGAMALFGEKYDPEVRVLSMNGNFSVELCGGTHTNKTGDIGLFKIISHTAVSAGIRRIEAKTGSEALLHIQEDETLINKLSLLLKANKANLVDKINHLDTKIKAKDKEIKKLQLALTSGESGIDYTTKAVDVKGIKVLTHVLEHIDKQALREIVDKFKNKLKSAVVAFAFVNEDDGKVTIATGVTNDNTNKISAGELANYIASQLGGKGGGRADFAMAGGNNPKNLDQALKSVIKWVESKI